jgi:regulator of replication initiation timing
MKDRYLNERAIANELALIDETCRITVDTFEMIDRAAHAIKELCDEAEFLKLENEQLKARAA